MGSKKSNKKNNVNGNLNKNSNKNVSSKTNNNKIDNLKKDNLNNQKNVQVNNKNSLQNNSNQPKKNSNNHYFNANNTKDFNSKAKYNNSKKYKNYQKDYHNKKNNYNQNNKNYSSNIVDTNSQNKNLNTRYDTENVKNNNNQNKTNYQNKKNNHNNQKNNNNNKMEDQSNYNKKEKVDKAKENIENIQENKKIEKENVICVKKENEQKSEKENNKEKKNKKSKLVIIITGLVASVMIGFVGFFVYNYNTLRIQTNVYIENIDVSNLTKEEAKKKLTKEYSKIIGKDLKCKYNESEYTFNVNDIDFELLLSDSLDDAIHIGRNDNIILAFKEFYSLKFGNTENVNIDYKYDRQKLYSKIMEFEKDFICEVRQYSYKVEDNVLKVENGKPGISVNYEEFENIFKDLIEEKSLERTIELPINTVNPEPIDLAKLYNEIYVDMKNASYTLNPFEIHEEVQGVNFDLQSLKKQIETETDKDEYCVPLIITEPTIKVADLDLYKDVLGEFSTAYVNNPNRTVNLQIAARKIDGMTLMPGETFSYNDVVGERTAAAGYRNAAIFVNGEVEDGLAGGICQVSSTLYDAVVFANLEIIERYNHARVPSYVSGGRDATVYWGSKDFKFKNNREYPIKISLSVGGGYARAVIYGTETENEYDISIETAVVSRYNGYMVVKAYKVYRQNGVVVNKELLSTDSYKIG